MTSQWCHVTPNMQPVSEMGRAPHLAAALVVRWAVALFGSCTLVTWAVALFGSCICSEMRGCLVWQLHFSQLAKIVQMVGGGGLNASLWNTSTSEYRAADEV